MYNLPIIRNKEYMKKVFQQGAFSEYILCPYGGSERSSVYNRIVVITDQVSEPTLFMYGRRQMALLLSHTDEPHQTIMQNYTGLLQHWTGVVATFFTARNIQFDKQFEFQSKKEALAE